MFVINKKIFFSLFVIFVYCFFCKKTVLSVERSDPGIVFLESIKNMTADYMQEQFEGQKVLLSNGKIAIKKRRVRRFLGGYVTTYKFRK